MNIRPALQNLVDDGLRVNPASGGYFEGSQITLPKLQQQADHQTAVIGKWHRTSAPTEFESPGADLPIA